MRNPNDRRHPHATSLYPFGDSNPGTSNANRRKTHDRRMENLSMEERQLLLSEMPSLRPPKSGA